MIKSYQDMQVQLIRATNTPAHLVGLAQAITMKQDLTNVPPITHKQVNFLVNAEHTSLLEHVTYTFLIQGVSRSFLAQITRQRTASPTSGSQHYQVYSDYDCAVTEELAVHPAMQDILQSIFSTYTNMLATGIPKEEARQVLPNAACVNYLWTIDARNLFFFLRQRLCNRNVEEMRVFANKVLNLVKQHFPELFDLAGPQCFKGECKQGFLQCYRGYWEAL